MQLGFVGVIITYLNVSTLCMFY